jgi:ribosome biogenesis GTPase
MSASIAILRYWCWAGYHFAILRHKSRVRKSLIGAKGRHTMTRRELPLIPRGCLVLKKPGMPQLEMADVATGIGDTFEGLQTAWAQCWSSDCPHERKPHCAVQDAIEP